MSHWIAITSNTILPAANGVSGLAALPPGNAPTGIGLLLKNLGGPFEALRDLPILSGIFSNAGLRLLDTFMMKKGFRTKYRITFHRSHSMPQNMPRRDLYLVRAYEYPDHWEEKEKKDCMAELVNIRLQLQEMDSAGKDMVVFSFWPDTVLIKETGHPAKVAEHLTLDKNRLSAKIIMAQHSHGTHPGESLNGCNPCFLKGFSTMTSGENTASATNREFLAARSYPCCAGTASTAETFTHILHYTVTRLNFGIEAYKHILTPLKEETLAGHPDRVFLKHLKQTCRQMIIDGPNCVVGCLPDASLFMVQDRKKRCPGIVGGGPGCYAFASDICGLDAVLPDRNRSRDFQPMHLDTVVVRAGGEKMQVHRQTDPLLKN